MVNFAQILKSSLNLFIGKAQWAFGIFLHQVVKQKNELELFLQHTDDVHICGVWYKHDKS